MFRNYWMFLIVYLYFSPSSHWLVSLALRHLRRNHVTTGVNTHTKNWLVGIDRERIRLIDNLVEIDKLQWRRFIELPTYQRLPLHPNLIIDFRDLIKTITKTAKNQQRLCNTQQKNGGIRFRCYCYFGCCWFSNWFSFQHHTTPHHIKCVQCVLKPKHNRALRLYYKNIA